MSSNSFSKLPPLPLSALPTAEEIQNVSERDYDALHYFRAGTNILKIKVWSVRNTACLQYSLKHGLRPGSNFYEVVDHQPPGIDIDENWTKIAPYHADELWTELDVYVEGLYIASNCWDSKAEAAIPGVESWLSRTSRTLARINAGEHPWEHGEVFAKLVSEAGPGTRYWWLADGERVAMTTLTRHGYDKTYIDVVTFAFDAKEADTFESGLTVPSEMQRARFMDLAREPLALGSNTTDVLFPGLDKAFGGKRETWASRWWDDDALSDDSPYLTVID